MFNRKKCKRCGRKVKDKDSFCPACGLSLGNFEKEDWGMLGKSDFISPEIKMPGFNMLFNSLMKDFGKPLFQELEKEMKKSTEKSPNQIRRGISISISTSGNSPPKIKINNLDGQPIKQINREMPIKKRKGVISILSEEKAKKFLTLPQEEPSTNIRRLSNKMVYEIALPGVKSLKDVSVMQLENSIEIKAVSKNKSYKKIIPIDFPIHKYKLSKEKLVLELGVKS